MFKSVKKELLLCALCVKYRTMMRMENPIAYVFITLGTFLNLAISIIFFQALYTQVSSIGGWNINQVIVLLGVYNFLGTFAWATYIRGNARVYDHVIDGFFDIFLSKPINIQNFFIYYWNNVYDIISLSVTVAMICYGLHAEDMLSQLPYLFGLMMVSVVLHYSVSSMITALNFWQPSWTYRALFQRLYQLAEYPRTIYTQGVQLLLMITIPTIVMVSVPVEIVFGQLSWHWIVYLIGITIVFTGLSRIAWYKGLQAYSSAGG